MTAWLHLKPLKLGCLPEEEAGVHFPRMCWSEDHKAIQRSNRGLHYMTLTLRTPTGVSLPRHWFAWWSWPMSSSPPHSFHFFMKKKGQANKFQGPFQSQSYMVRYYGEAGNYLWGGSSMSVVNFPKAGDKWEIHLWPLLDVPFPETRQTPKVWVQVTFRKVPGVLRSRGGGICFSNMNNDPFN